MTAIDTAFWTELDAKMATARSADHEVEPPQAVEMPDAAGSRHGADEHGTGPARARSDWTDVLETIAASKSASDQQQAELREHAAARAALQLDLERTRETVRILDSLLAETRAEVDLRVREAEAQADARVRIIQAKANAAVQEAYELMRAAELRAETAEDWLARIEQASLNLKHNGLLVAA